MKTDEQEKKPQKSPVKEARRYTGAKQESSEKLNETETGIRQSRGKKQRRTIQPAPNRG